MGITSIARMPCKHFLVLTYLPFADGRMGSMSRQPPEAQSELSAMHGSHRQWFL